MGEKSSAYRVFLDDSFGGRAAVSTDGDHRRLVQDDPATAHVNQCVGRSEVDGQIFGKVAAKYAEHEILSYFEVRRAKFS
jgi:hypothetical protein